MVIEVVCFKLCTMCQILVIKIYVLKFLFNFLEFIIVCALISNNHCKSCCSFGNMSVSSSYSIFSKNVLTRGKIVIVEYSVLF